MAVVLCRDGKPFINPVPSELRGLPRISLECKPVPNHSSYLGKRVTTRTESHLSCQDQPREKERKEVHEKHHVQLTQCGFHSSNCKPYKELGKVELDDGRLILETLGQATKEVTMDTQVKRAESPKPKLEMEREWLLHPGSMVSPYNVKLHSKTPSQFPSELLCLSDKVKQGEVQLGHMKRGRSLFSLMEEERRKKELFQTEQARLDHDEAMHNWKEGEVTFDLSEMDAEPHLLRPPDQHDPHRKKSSISTDFQQSLGIDKPPKEVGSSEESKAVMIEWWYRRLCVMVWILEAMQLESPHHCIPLGHCWDLKPQYVEDSVGKQRHEFSTLRMTQWEDMKKRKRHYKPTFKNKVTSMMALIRLTPKRGLSPTPPTPTQTTPLATRISQSHSSISQLEEEEMKRRKEFERKIAERWVRPIAPMTLDIPAMKDKFLDSEEKRRMIVHEQLAAMERDRMEALQQRLGSLNVSTHMWNDLASMREGLAIESTSMARKKLLMNYKWYDELLSSLPAEVTEDHYSWQLLKRLREIADYMCSVGPRRMSRRKLIQVLAILDPWELQAPDVQGAIEHLIRHVVYIAEEDYREWLRHHTIIYCHSHTFKTIMRKTVEDKKEPERTRTDALPSWNTSRVPSSRAAPSKPSSRVPSRAAPSRAAPSKPSSRVPSRTVEKH